ncbi:heterokaryon incompatibility protein-domain-containing protein [Cercophora newfieldiana]|uniref:Heterokaryon incompatibility protein-domain-containing protein n=1 Tax=Cercophora newfieldiana TaxID=92897 RepID=A0AA39YCJ5_9PEZI|nr:heterokaryon incompatibility protein-domain-containing protein [Cercophora newfieldiana]
MSESEGYHSCAFCARIVLDINKSAPPPLPDGQPDEPPEEPLVFFGITIQDIWQASASCELCTWFMSWWKRKFKVDADTMSRHGNAIFLCAETYSRSFVGRFPVDEVVFWLWDVRRATYGTRGRIMMKLGARSVDVWTKQGDPASGSIHNRPVSQIVWSPDNVSLAGSWLHECLASHEACVKLTPSYMPKRILRVWKTVQGDYVVQLQEKVSAAQYVTLSYCWGGDQIHKTTKARVQVPDPIIDWDCLPKTIQDSVRATVDLGIDYLWVDSLCIVQDDGHEVALQIAEMPRIYTHAVLTIMASRAAKASEGFLNNIDLHGHEVLRTRLPFRCPDGSLGSAFLRYEEKGHSDVEPIDYRAWTYQEYYLSQRILAFGSLQTRWVCMSSSWRKNSAEPIDDSIRFTNGWKWQHDQDDSRLQVFDMHQKTLDAFKDFTATARDESERESLFVERWHCIVVTYSRRSLSFTKDRILAISGIAEILSPSMKDDYLAGHWRRALPRDLMWHMWTEYTPLNPRPLEYQGPSWSWTGTNGEVDFKYNRAVREPRLTILDAQTELAVPQAPFGSVKRGHVTVRGRLRKALWFGTSHSNGRTNVLKCLSNSDEGEKEGEPLLITKVMPDAIEKEFSASDFIATQPLEVYLLEFGELTGLGLRGLCGIMLRDASGGGSAAKRFSRLGVFHVDAKLVKKKPDDVEAVEWSRRTEEELRLFDSCELRDIFIE